MESGAFHAHMAMMAKNYAQELQQPQKLEFAPLNSLIAPYTEATMKQIRANKHARIRKRPFAKDQKKTAQLMAVLTTMIHANRLAFLQKHNASQTE